MRVSRVPASDASSAANPRGDQRRWARTRPARIKILNSYDITMS